MKSLATHMHNAMRRTFVLIDYLVWLIFDPSKFTIVDKSKIKKVLIIHLGAMGELIVATPLLHTLKKELNAKIAFLVSPGKEDVLRGNPSIDEILAYNGNFEKDLAQLKSKKFDLAVILWPGLPQISWLCIKAGIHYRIGVFKNVKDGLNFFFTRRMLDLRKDHAVQSTLDIIRTIGIDNPKPKLEFYLSSEDKRKGKRLLQKLKLKDYAVIHPGFSFSDVKYPSRWWPAERYAEVADWLISRGMKVALTGNYQEKKFSDEIFRLVKNKKAIIITNGKITLRNLAFLIANSKVLIAPGTGVIHLASALETPIVELMGKESPKEWHPWANKKDYRILFHPEVCTECDKNYCRKKTQECMKAIKSEDVINAIKSLLTK